MVALITTMISCAQPAQYNLTISSTEGGELSNPGDGTFSYYEGTVVPLVALPHIGYRFVNWTGDADTIANINSAWTTITMDGDYSIIANFAVEQYSLVVRSTEGGSVTTPGENAYTYDKGDVVNLVAVPDEGYVLTDWTGDVGTIADINAASTTITMNGGYSITANFAKGIRDWYDLDAIRNNLDGSYVLMNDLDSATAGYDELAGPTADSGKGWQPIGALFGDPVCQEIVDPVDPFAGGLDGQGYEIRDLFTSRAEEDGVGLFGCVGKLGFIANLRVVNVNVIGRVYVGGVVGLNDGAVSNACSTGSVSGHEAVGGLVGWNYGTVADSYSTSTVTGEWAAGGLIGLNHNAVGNSYASGSVVAFWEVGGLVGGNAWGIVSNSYSTGSITGQGGIGGLVGRNWGSTVSNSYYNCDDVLINGKRVITVGALVNEDFEQWLANDKVLNVNERLSREGGYYIISNVNDFRSLLAFGQNPSLKFQLRTDLDLSDEPDFYVPYLAGEFDGNSHKISNLNFDIDFVSNVGLFGHLASGGQVTGVILENVDIRGCSCVGSLAGLNDGTVGNSCASGRVAGDSIVGGLIGAVHTGTVSRSFSTSSVSGYCTVGGLVGWYDYGIVDNSYYNCDEVMINGHKRITIGALFNEDFETWVTNDRCLDIGARLSQEDGHYVIGTVSDFKQLLAFGQNAALKFKLTNDLDLAAEPGFYIPYLACEFDGNGHKISNLSLNFDSVSQVGVFGCMPLGSKVTRLAVENAHVTACSTVGGLVGYNRGLVSDSYVTGSVAGGWNVGGLTGWNLDGTVGNSYLTSSVTGEDTVGGLIGRNQGTVYNSFSIGRVTSHSNVGGLVGYNRGTSTVSNSLWNIETAGQATSDGGTGKTTTEMKNIATFTSAGWNIIAVAPGEPNTAYIWNIVDGHTYPFLSWRS